MLIDVSEIKKTIKPKADSTLNNMRKADLIEYIRCLEHNYNAAVWFNENQARYIERLGLDPASLRSKGEWISVEDRLPERGQEVIVYRNDCVYSMRFWDEKHPLWQSTSHWMPLPEPPGVDMRGGT